MKNKDFKILTIADIHFGVRKHIELLDKTIDFAIATVKKTKPNYVFILGDTFDRLISLNNEQILLFNKLVIGIKEVSKKTKIHIVEGTASHDMRQIRSFLQYKVIDKYYDEAFVGELDGYSLCVLPEEYKFNYRFKYKDILEGKYDLVFGHGNITNMIFAENSLTQSYIHSKDDLKKMTKYYCVFGHNHVLTYDSTTNPKVIYNSSLYRFSFEGEKSKKGMHLITLNKSKNKSEIVFIENKNTPKFRTVKISKFLNKDYKENFDSEEFLNLFRTYYENMKSKYAVFSIRLDLQDLKLNNNVNSLIEHLISKYKIVIKNRRKNKEVINSERIKNIAGYGEAMHSDINIIKTISNEILDNYKDIDLQTKEKTLNIVNRLVDEY